MKLNDLFWFGFFPAGEQAPLSLKCWNHYSLTIQQVNMNEEPRLLCSFQTKGWDDLERLLLKGNRSSGPVWAVHLPVGPGRQVQERSEAPWLHYQEGQRALTNDSLGGKHLSPYSLDSTPSLWNRGSGPAARARHWQQMHRNSSSGTSAAMWSTPKIKYSGCCHSSLVAAAVIAGGNGRRRGGVSDADAVLKCVDRLSQPCIHQHADELWGPNDSQQLMCWRDEK